MNLNRPFRKRCFQLLVSALLATSSAQAAFTVLDYWHMGENDSGANSGTGCTNTIDIIGGRTLTNTPNLSAYPTYTNDISMSAATNTGSQFALRLNGGQYATGDVLPSLVDNFGIELWVKPANMTSGTKMIAYNGNTSASGWGIFQDGGVYEGLFGGVAIFGSAPAVSNVWTHLALVRSNGTARLYINGVAAGTTSTTPNLPNGNFLIGANNVHTETFAGEIDEVRAFTFGSGEFNVTNLLFSQNSSFGLSTTSLSVGASAGTASVNLTVSSTNVSWTASSLDSWIHVSNSSGTGNATISFTFDDNPWLPRSGTLNIAGQTVSVTQDPPSYSLNGNYNGYLTGDVVYVPAGAGSNSVGLTVVPNVGGWGVTTYESWIHPTSSGPGSGNISFTFDANTDPGGAARMGLVSVINAANSLVRFYVVQQAPPSGAGQTTYHFTGHLLPYLPQFIPADASPALKSVQSNDVFFLTMTLVPSPSYILYETWAAAVNHITFSVPSRGLVYSKSFGDLQVLHDGINPDTLRWDAYGVDSSTAMIFWARDFNQSALSGGNVPSPLNLSGFHANGFAQIILFNAVGGNPTLFYGDLVPLPDLKLEQLGHTNQVSWMTSDSFYLPKLQTKFSLDPNALWTDVTNVPVSQALTNIVTLPATNGGGQFFRLKVL